MKQMAFFSLIAGLILTVTSCGGESKKSTEESAEPDSTQMTAGKYVNEKFGFSITYPSEILSPDPTITSDSGQVFVSEDGTANLKVWIDPRLVPVEGEAINLQQLFDLDTAYKSGYENSYKKFNTISYTIAGVRGGQQVFYQKTIIANGHVVTGLFRYSGDSPEKKTYDAMIEPLFKSFQ